MSRYVQMRYISLFFLEIFIKDFGLSVNSLFSSITLSSIIRWYFCGMSTTFADSGKTIVCFTSLQLLLLLAPEYSELGLSTLWITL